MLCAVICPERARLLSDYREAVHRYSARVTELVELVGLDLNTDVELLRRRAREAWDASEQARVALSRHEGSHFCHQPDFGPTPA
jgi:hypothetical protein